MRRSIGLILLCIFLLAYGLFALTNFEMKYEDLIMGCLAIGSAIFLALGK